jgi:hypothetical protein
MSASGMGIAPAVIDAAVQSMSDRMLRFVCVVDQPAGLL